MINFNKNQLYYCFLFKDKDLKQPVITTLQFIEKTKYKDKTKWVFSEVDIYDNTVIGEERNCSFDDSTIKTVVPLEVLMKNIKNQWGI